MEQQLPADNEPLFELKVDYDSGNRFKESSKWGRFIAIIYFIAIGFALLGLTFGASYMINLFSNSSPVLASAGGIVIAVLFVIAAVYVYITIQLFRFATLIRESIERQDQTTFNHALKALRNYLMASGIVSLLVILWSLYDTIRTVSYNF